MLFARVRACFTFLPDEIESKENDKRKKAAWLAFIFAIFNLKLNSPLERGVVSERLLVD